MEVNSDERKHVPAKPTGDQGPCRGPRSAVAGDK